LLTPKENATDSAMIIDAMDLLYTKKVDAFVLMTSDSDFTPLVLRKMKGLSQLFNNQSNVLNIDED